MVRREILAVLKANEKEAKSLKLKGPCPLNLLSMCFTSTSTCMMNQLKKFMQVEVDVVYMFTKFGVNSFVIFNFKRLHHFLLRFLSPRIGRRVYTWKEWTLTREKCQNLLRNFV